MKHDFGASVLTLIADRLAPWRSPEEAVDLNRLARELGVRDVLYRPTKMHGFTEWTSRGPIIQIAASTSDGRRRATLAHECAHVLFDPIWRKENVSAWGRSDLLNRLSFAESIIGEYRAELAQLQEKVGLEKVCDMLAFELLIPARALPFLSNRISSLETLQAACRQYRVSLALMTIQTNKLGKMFSILRFARSGDGQWIIIDSLAAPLPWDIGAALAGPTSYRVDQAPSGVIDMELGLEPAAESNRVAATVSKRPTTMLAFCLRSDFREGHPTEPASSRYTWSTRDISAVRRGPQ